jgi:hypothetical protein
MYCVLLLSAALPGRLVVLPHRCRRCAAICSTGHERRAEHSERCGAHDSWRRNDVGRIEDNQAHASEVKVSHQSLPRKVSCSYLDSYLGAPKYEPSSNTVFVSVSSLKHSFTLLTWTGTQAHVQHRRRLAEASAQEASKHRVSTGARGERID